MKDKELLQCSLFTEKQVFHTNYTDETIIQKLEEVMETSFNQAEIETVDKTYYYKLTSKGKLLTNVKKKDNGLVIKPHNREKKYLLKEGEVIPPLVDLGVMNEEGFIVKAYFDKYKQINRFLEIIEDTIGEEKSLHIIDFGCGKSYLTFILYYYLAFIKKIDFSITGLDLKEEVIQKCNQISEKYHYDSLHFELGDISLYQPSEKVDMIITLYACDTATDYAIYHAIMLKTKYLLSVPCCQHEINLSLKKEQKPVLNHFGILKERASAIYTDAIRGNILEYYGYKVDIMEFIDIAHSPKNLLIKAILKGPIKEEVKQTLKAFMDELGCKQTLYDLCFKTR